jgi:hypothetical protein
MTERSAWSNVLMGRRTSMSWSVVSPSSPTTSPYSV